MLRFRTVLALGWTPRRNIDGLHLSPKCFDSGKGHPCTFDTDRPLYNLKSRARINKPLHKSKLVATYGVSDLIVVDTDDALLITTRANSQNVKKIFDTLKSKSREECTRNRSELRYWGGVQNVHSSNDYKINILTIEPFKEISYQQHNHRIECWYILKGKAIITMDDISLEYNSNDSILIRPGCKHKIKNDTNESLVVVEIQDGLIKDDVDITRYNK